MSDLILSATVVATDTEVWNPGWIRVAGTRIVSCGEGVPPSDLTGTRQHVEGTLVPGFVDIHSHGAAGADFGRASEGSVDAALNRQFQHGTTSLVASLATAPLRDLEYRIAALVDLVVDDALVGVHLEGPWLSENHRGAHASRLLRHPAADEVLRLMSSTDVVRMVTLAPELPGGLPAIRQIVGEGAVAAIGHTSCDADTARRAFDDGATVATHLFNGMPPIHHRASGPVGAALLDDRVTLELILDGEHLAPDTVDLVLRVAPGRIAAISDSISATGCPDGEFTLAGSSVTVCDGVARTTATGSLAGSTRTLDTAFAALVREHGRTLPEAVAATSTTAARTIGLAGVGVIAPGAWADLVVLEELGVTGVMRHGAWIRLPG